MPPFYIPADEGDIREICVRVLEYVYMRAWQGIYETFRHLTYLLMIFNLFREIPAYISRNTCIYFEKYLYLFREIPASISRNQCRVPECVYVRACQRICKTFWDRTYLCVDERDVPEIRLAYICLVSRYGVPTRSRLLKIIGLFCKRALWKRRYSAEETWNFKEPTNRRHPIVIAWYSVSL